jgi:hypothetical protein
MIDGQLILALERLRDELTELKAAIHSRYRGATRQVRADDIKTRAARAAETWMVNLAHQGDIRELVASDYLAELNVQFQRLLTCSEHAAQRRRYTSAIQAILKDFTLALIMPLKRTHSQGGGTQSAALTDAPRQHPGRAQTNSNDEFVRSAFVGHSFLPADKRVAECVTQCLIALGISVATGEKPRADRISEKVKGLIDGQYIFVGVFTRRDKISHKNEWTTTSWVLDEKAYAVGKNKKLVLIKEEGVGSIGGIQGDHEFIEFGRDHLEVLLVRLMQVFDIEVTALKN